MNRLLASSCDLLEYEAIGFGVRQELRFFKQPKRVGFLESSCVSTLPNDIKKKIYLDIQLVVVLHHRSVSELSESFYTFLTTSVQILQRESIQHQLQLQT